MNEPSTNQPNQDAPSSQDNSPISLPGNEAPPKWQDGRQSGFDRTLWYTIGGILLASCCGILLVGYLITQTSAFKKLTTFNPLISNTPLPTHNMGATQTAWVKPTQSPTLGSKEETTRALDAGNTYPFVAFATDYPDMPKVNQPGDLYIFNIVLSKSRPLLWDYGWCTTTPDLLVGNFNQMKVEFFVNEQPVTGQPFAVKETQPSKNYYCRTLYILVTKWPEGVHKLDVDVTFLKPTDDGMNIYPAGTHTYRYFVSVQP